VEKTDWPHGDLRDLGPQGPYVWLTKHGIDICYQARLIDPEDPLTDHAIARLRKALFVNQGWRLTSAGLKLLGERYNSYVANSDDNNIMTGRVLLGLEDALRGPWAVRGKSLIVFEPMLHFELQMVDGSAQQFVNFKKHA